MPVPAGSPASVKSDRTAHQQMHSYSVKKGARSCGSEAGCRARRTFSFNPLTLRRVINCGLARRLCAVQKKVRVERPKGLP